MAWYFIPIQPCSEVFVSQIAFNIDVLVVLKACEHTLLCSLSMKVISRIIDKIKFSFVEEGFTVRIN